MRNHSGFSLLEILIALAILIVGVAAIVNVFPVGLHASKRAADFTSAAILAQEKMAELMYLGYGNWNIMDSDLSGNPDGGGAAINSGKEPFSDPAYKWYMNIADDEHDINNLVKATLWIYWNDRGNETNETFITYIAKRD